MQNIICEISKGVVKVGGEKRESLLFEKDLMSQGYKAVKNDQVEGGQVILYSKPETQEEALEIALQTHSWGFAIVDNAATFREGMKEVESIRKLVRSIGIKGYDMVYKYISDHFDYGFTADFYR